MVKLQVFCSWCVFFSLEKNAEQNWALRANRQVLKYNCYLSDIIGLLGKTKFLIVISDKLRAVSFTCDVHLCFPNSTRKFDTISSVKIMNRCGSNILLLFTDISHISLAWWLTRCFVLFCSTCQRQVTEEYMGHSGGDARSRAVWLRCRLHRRAHQGLPVWCVFASGQGTRSALPRSTHRCVRQAACTST